MVCQRPPFIPPSPPRALIRSLRRTLKKPTCSLFGPHRETLYSDYFFCANCKIYDDYASSGYARRIGRDSRRFKCTANHTDFFFPTDRLIVDNKSNHSSHGKSSNASCSDRESDVMDSESMEGRSIYDSSDDETMLAHVLQDYELLLRQKLKEQEDNFRTIIKQLQDELRLKSDLVNDLNAKAASLQDLVSEHTEKINELLRETLLAHRPESTTDSAGHDQHVMVLVWAHRMPSL